MPTRPHSTRSTPKTHVSRRNTTIQRDLVRDIENGLQLNPVFTDTDRAVRDALFDPTLCFVSGKDIGPGATGDHLYEVRNYHRFTKRYGVDSQWNRIPVHHTENTKYKVFEIYMEDDNTKVNRKVKRNVGFETLTKAEYEACTPKEQFIYDLLQAWKTYVGYRGVQLSFELPDATTERMNEVVRRALATIDEEAAAVVAEYNACALSQNDGEQTHAKVGEDTVGEADNDNVRPRSSSPTPQAKCLAHASSDPPAPPPISPSVNAWPPYNSIKWRIEKRERQSGKSKGKWDTYYHHVDTGKVCRSKREACEYQQTATVPPPRPTLVVPKHIAVPAAGTPTKPQSSRLLVPHQAVAAWVLAIVTQALARVTSSPWAAARALFASTCPRRTAKMSSTSC